MIISRPPHKTKALACAENQCRVKMSACPRACASLPSFYALSTLLYTVVLLSSFKPAPIVSFTAPGVTGAQALDVCLHVPEPWQ